jgi:hypothetical protein
MCTKYLQFLIAAFLAVSAVQATAATSETTAIVAVSSTSDAAYLKRIESSYTDFAGSSTNLESLTNGLRHGTAITLTDSGTTGNTSSMTFTPSTRPMGYGNINRVLDFASRDLVAAGISDPSAEQIQTALIGGTVVNTQGQIITMDGILRLRSQGMGWGQIAHQIGISPAANSNGQNASTTNAAGLSGSSKHTNSSAKVSGEQSGIVNAEGSSSTGLTTASGRAASAGGSHSSIVSADGGATTSSNAFGHNKAGIVSAGGISAANSGIATGSGAASAHGALGVSSNGNAFGLAKGKN